eukprot:403362923
MDGGGGTGSMKNTGSQIQQEEFIENENQSIDGKLADQECQSNIQNDRCMSPNELKNLNYNIDVNILELKGNPKNQPLPNENFSDFEKVFQEKYYVKKGDQTNLDSPKASAFKMPNIILDNEEQISRSFQESEEKVKVLKIPLNWQNILTLCLIIVLTVIGTIYIWILSTQKHCQCRLCRKEFILLESIGEGGFGAVYLVQKPISKSKFFNNQTETQSAKTSLPLKIQDSNFMEQPQKYILKKLEMKDITDLERVQYEAKQLRRLNHKNIVSYEDEFMHINEGTIGNKYVYVIIMEYCEGGDLTDKIREYNQEQMEKWGSEATIEKVSMPEHKVMKYFIEMCEAVRYIHARDIIHRDIKSPNVFLTQDDTVKLGDFGLCIQAKSIVTKAKYSSVGTDCYFSPEQIKGQLYQKGRASDVWAIGLILLEMMVGCPVWDLGFDFGIKAIESPHFIFDYISENIPSKYDQKLKQILKKMLIIDPAQRYTIEDVMKKKFIRQWQNKIKHESFKIQQLEIKEKRKQLVSSEKKISAKSVQVQDLNMINDEEQLKNGQFQYIQSQPRRRENQKRNK